MSHPYQIARLYRRERGCQRDLRPWYPIGSRQDIHSQCDQEYLDSWTCSLQLALHRWHISCSGMPRFIETQRKLDVKAIHFMTGATGFVGSKSVLELRSCSEQRRFL